MKESFLKRILNKPPMIFPWVALFHLLMLIFSLWFILPAPFPGREWLQPLWVVLLGISWLGVCDLKRWAGFAYLGLTALNLVLLFAVEENPGRPQYAFIFFEITILFSFFILFYFRRFRNDA